MSQWTSRVLDHRIWAAMNTLGKTIDQAVAVDDIAPEALEALERLQRGAGFDRETARRDRSCGDLSRTSRRICGCV